MSATDPPGTLLAATAHLLRPLVRILLRFGVSHTAFSDLAKAVYVDVARTDFALPGKRPTGSRISAITGLSRKEVARLDAAPERLVLDTSSINRAARVIGGWVRDPEFHDARGGPAELPFEGGTRSFTGLVRKYSGDITPRTIADELARTGALSVTATGALQLNSRAYLPTGADVEKLKMLGTDVASLIGTIDHNLTQPQQPRFQRKVAYRLVPVAARADLNRELGQIAQEALERMDELLSQRAVGSENAGTGGGFVRVGVGIYYFEEDQP